MTDFANTRTTTPFWSRRRNVRLASALLMITFTLSFVIYISAHIVADDLMDEAFYTQALDENAIYDRVYTELLADPELQNVTNSLLGNLSLDASTSETVSSYTVSTLRLVLPPVRLRTAIEGAITELVAYFRGDTRRYEASLHLAEALNGPELTDKLTVYGQAISTELLTAWLGTAVVPSDQVPPSDSQIAAFASDLERFAWVLSSGDLAGLPDARHFIDINRVPVEKRAVFADALLSPFEGTARSEIRNQVETSLAAGDLVGAMSIAAGEIIRPYVGAAVAELQNVLDDGRLDGIKSLAGLVEDKEQHVVSKLNLVRDIIVGLRYGAIVPLSGALMIVSLAALGWLHAHNVRRAMRTVGGTLIISSVVLTVIWFGVFVVIAAPLQIFTDIDVTALPVSLRNMMNDVLRSLIEEIGTALSNRTAVAFNIGLLLIVLTFVPDVSQKAWSVFSRAMAAVERTTGLSIERPRNAVAIAIALIVLVPIAVDIFFIREGTAAAAMRTCNGHEALCERPLDDVVFAATHNSMSISSAGWVWPIHDGGITEQLAYGIRGFLIDTHYWDTETQVRAFVEQVPPDMQPVVEEILASQRELLQELSKDGVYTCHGLCLLGSTPLVDMLAEFRVFLDANPYEVIVVIIQDAITPADTEAAFRDAGLLEYLYARPQGSLWPTLGEMIDRNQRLIVMAEEANADSADPSPAWYVNAWTVTQENPYSIHGLDEFSCAPNRGDPENDLFLLNHWIDRVSPSRVDAARVNAYDFLIDQARRCEVVRDRLPNFVAVNFYSIGDLMAVVDELNGVNAIMSSQAAG